MKRLFYLFVFVLGLSFMTSCASQDSLEEISIENPRSAFAASEPLKDHKPQDNEEVKKDKSPF